MQRLMGELRNGSAPEPSTDPSEETLPIGEEPAYDYDLDLEGQHEFYVGEEEMQALLDAGAELFVDEPDQVALGGSQQPGLLEPGGSEDLGTAARNAESDEQL